MFKYFVLCTAVAVKTFLLANRVPTIVNTSDTCEILGSYGGEYEVQSLM
jgi:hypothetical protein